LKEKSGDTPRILLLVVVLLAPSSETMKSSLRVEVKDSNGAVIAGAVKGEIFRGAGALDRLTVGIPRERLPKPQNRDLFDDENLRDNEGANASQDPSSH
jgi:hypothetical protein